MLAYSLAEVWGRIGSPAAPFGSSAQDCKATHTQMKNDATVVMEAVQQNGLALQYASEEMKGNETIVMAAVKQYGFALRHASEEMKGNPAGRARRRRREST